MSTPNTLTKDDAEREVIQPRVLPEVARWIRVECASERISHGELIDGLVLAEQSRRATKSEGREGR